MACGRLNVVLLGGAFGLLATSFVEPAGAFEAEVFSSTTAQGYQVRSPWGAPVLSRRRYLQTLGLDVNRIGEGAADDPDVSVHLQVRFDSDFGVRSEEQDPKREPQSTIPGLRWMPVDLMLGYVQVKNLADGMLSLRAGRQYIVDALGWWSLDGLWVRTELPIHLALETYGGFEPRGGLPMSTSRFESDGVWRGDRSKMEANFYPEFLAAHMAPAHGFAVETFGWELLHARLAYRRVWNTGPVAYGVPSTQAAAVSKVYDGWRISQERLAASVDGSLDEVGIVQASAIYDLNLSRWTSWSGSVDAFASDRVTLGLDADRVVPSFDGDSIWNWFATDPTTTALGRVSLPLGPKWNLAAASGLRWTELEDVSDQDRVVSGLGRVSARYRHADGLLAATATLDRGPSLARQGIDIHADHWFLRRFGVSGRLGLHDWSDDKRPDRDATSVGYLMGAGFRPGGEQTTLQLSWEHDMNRLVGHRYRVLAMLDVLVTK